MGAHTKEGMKNRNFNHGERRTRRQRSVWKQVLTRRKAEEPLADFDDSLAVLKFGPMSGQTFSRAVRSGLVLQFPMRNQSKRRRSPGREAR